MDSFNELNVLYSLYTDVLLWYSYIFVMWNWRECFCFVLFFCLIFCSSQNSSSHGRSGGHFEFRTVCALELSAEPPPVAINLRIGSDPTLPVGKQDKNSVHASVMGASEVRLEQPS